MILFKAETKCSQKPASEQLHMLIRHSSARFPAESIFCTFQLVDYIEKLDYASDIPGSEWSVFIHPSWVKSNPPQIRQMLLIHPTPHFPIIFPFLQYKGFGDWQWQRQLLPGCVFISEHRKGSSLGEITAGPAREGSAPWHVWHWDWALLMALGGELTPLMIDNYQTCQPALWISRSGAGGGRKKS